MPEPSTIMRVSVVALGVTVGGVGGWLLGPSLAVPETAEPSAPDSGVVAAGEGVAAGGLTSIEGCEPIIDELAEQVEALEFERRMVEGQLALLGGVPLVWPAAAVGEARAADVEAALEGARPDGEFTVVGVDCDEPPCLAAIEVPGKDGGRPSPGSVVPWIEDSGLLVETFQFRPVDGGRVRAVLRIQEALEEVDRDVLEARLRRRSSALFEDAP